MLIACNILNTMTELGRPESFAIGPWPRGLRRKESVPLHNQAPTPQVARSTGLPLDDGMKPWPPKGVSPAALTNAGGEG